MLAVGSHQIYRKLKIHDMTPSSVAAGTGLCRVRGRGAEDCRTSRRETVGPEGLSQARGELACRTLDLQTESVPVDGAARRVESDCRQAQAPRASRAGRGVGVIRVADVACLGILVADVFGRPIDEWPERGRLSLVSG